MIVSNQQVCEIYIDLLKFITVYVKTFLHVYWFTDYLPHC